MSLFGRAPGAELAAKRSHAVRLLAEARARYLMFLIEVGRAIPADIPSPDLRACAEYLRDWPEEKLDWLIDRAGDENTFYC
jgi:hypothetical protein